MFCVLKIGDWRGVGGTDLYQIAKDGVEAVKERERLGLPPSPVGRVTVKLEQEVIDRRAAESWPEALNSDADLYLAILGDEHSEVYALVKSGLLAFSGPEKLRTGRGDSGEEIGLRLKLTVTPWELVQWRRAWHAEQRAIAAEKELAEAEERIATLESEEVTE